MALFIGQNLGNQSGPEQGWSSRGQAKRGEISTDSWGNQLIGGGPPGDPVPTPAVYCRSQMTMTEEPRASLNRCPPTALGSSSEDRQVRTRI